MAQDAKDFLARWVPENVRAEPGDLSTAEELADECRAEAGALGISSQHLDAAANDMAGGGGGLVEYLTDATGHAVEVQPAAKEGAQPSSARDADAAAARE